MTEIERLREIIQSYDTGLYNLVMEYCHIDKRAIAFIEDEMARLRPLWSGTFGAPVYIDQLPAIHARVARMEHVAGCPGEWSQAEKFSPLECTCIRGELLAMSEVGK